MKEEREKAREKLEGSFNRNQAVLSLTSQERREWMIELLQLTESDSVSGSLAEAVKFYLNNKGDSPT